jgi:hypothetical protein
LELIIPMIVVGIVCFAGGYGLRAYISYRRRYHR